MGRRIFVHVNSDIDIGGFMMPKAIRWKDGRVFSIEAVTDFRPADSLAGHLPGDCYTVVISGKTKYLYFERIGSRVPGSFGRWFVLVG